MYLEIRIVVIGHVYMVSWKIEGELVFGIQYLLI